MPVWVDIDPACTPTPLKDPEFGIRGPAEAFAPQIALQIYVCAGDLSVSSRSAFSVKVVKLAP